MSITKEDVHWCYRAILGREPENEAVVQSKVASHQDFASLRQSFLRSQEFRGNNAASQQLSATIRFPLDHERLNIDHKANPEQLKRCLAHIKAAWSHLGKTSPHHSVLTSKDFLPENLEGNIEAFWKSGQEEAEQIQAILKRHGMKTSGKCCVEFGCGVGRVTMALAKKFSGVFAYDISQSHLSLAAERLNEVGLKNVKFHLCTENVLPNLKKCDFFYSRIVFQHNPPPIIEILVKKALQSLNLNGIAIFQIPIYRNGYNFILEKWLSEDHKLDMQMHCLPQEVVFDIAMKNNCEILEVREDGSSGTPFLSNIFVIRKKTNQQILKKTFAKLNFLFNTDKK